MYVCVCVVDGAALTSNRDGGKEAKASARSAGRKLQTPDSKRRNVLVAHVKDCVAYGEAI